MTILELTILCSSIIFFILFLWQAILLARTTRAIEVSNKCNAALLLENSEYKLSYAVLEQMKTQLESQKAIIENIQITNERISSYNERLNGLALAVRTKFEQNLKI